MRKLRLIKVVVYGRVSTPEQAVKGYSVEAQIEKAKEYCKDNNKEFIRSYTDRGISGKSTKDRVGLAELLEDCKKGLFDEVIVWKTSRLARNVADLGQIINILEKNNIVFRSLSEPYDTSTSQGRLMLNLFGSFAEFERTTIIENLKMGMNARARLGYKNGGKLLGYRSEGSGKDSRLVVVEKEADLIRMIFKMYSEGKGYKAITNRINKLGYKTIRGNYFNINGVKEILNNPTYIGKIRFNKYVDYSTKRRKGLNEDYILVEGRHEAIVDKETWDKVRLLQKQKSSRYSTRNKGKFPLTGMLKCPVCGAGMVSANSVNTLKDGTKRRIRYYSCGTFKNKGSAACSANSVRADYAEEYVFNKIKAVLINEKVLKDVVDNMNKNSCELVKPMQEKRSIISKKMKESKEKKNKVFDLYEEGIIDKETLSDRISNIDSTIQEQEKELKRIDEELNNTTQGEIPYKVVKGIMNDFHKLINNAEPHQRKLFLKMIIDDIAVTQGKIKKIHINFNETIRNMINTFSDNEEELSDDESSSFSFVFKLAI